MFSAGEKVFEEKLVYAVKLCIDKPSKNDSEILFLAWEADIRKAESFSRVCVFLRRIWREKPGMSIS